VPFAQVVDRRVRHLRETLAEVRVDGPGAPGEQRQRRVVTHRRGRFVPTAGDGPQDHVHVFARIAEDRLPPGEIAFGRLDRRPVRFDVQAVGEPLAVRPPRGETVLDAGVVLEAALGIDCDHLTRPEAAATDRSPPGEVHRACLGAANDEAVGADGVPQGPQPVAVERGSDDSTVGEHESRRPIPRLDQK
jgi:hypothetical protein